MKKLSKILYYLAIVVLAAVFLFCAVNLIKYYSESAQTQGEYDDLAGLVENARPAPVHPTQSTDPDVSTPTDETAAPTTPWVTITDPDTGEPMEILPEYAELYQLNTDLVGWISIENTKVNYPVVQRPQSTDYYLHKDFYKKYAYRGCIYVREECDVLTPSDNLTIYGHRMNDGTMFGDLGKYTKKSYWEDNQYIRFDTILERHTYQIICVFRTTASIGEGFQYHLFVDAASEEEFDDFLASCRKNQYYNTGVTATYGDKLITLSTCEYSRENGRLVVVAKRID